MSQVYHIDETVRQLSGCLLVYAGITHLVNLCKLYDSIRISLRSIGRMPGRGDHMKKTAKTETVVTKRTSVLVGSHWSKVGPRTDYRLIKLDKAQVEKLLVAAGDQRDIFLNAFEDGNISALI